MDDHTEAIGIYLLLIQETQSAMARLAALREKGWDGRAISIAMTHIETAQLWATNAKPEAL